LNNSLIINLFKFTGFNLLELTLQQCIIEKQLLMK
jgi:hypothetical protein